MNCLVRNFKEEEGKERKKREKGDSQVRSDQLLIGLARPGRRVRGKYSHCSCIICRLRAMAKEQRHPGHFPTVSAQCQAEEVRTFPEPARLNLEHWTALAAVDTPTASRHSHFHLSRQQPEPSCHCYAI